MQVDGHREQADLAALDAEAEAFRRRFGRVVEEVGKFIVGQGEVVEGTLIALLAGGHVLLEGVPGLGKTMLVRSLSRALDLSFSRIQFTPDLMPADITGTDMVMEDERGRRFFQFQPGPIFANVVLADEINRATPKTQSALLEAMQEGSVTVGKTTYELESPFFVMATQNPIEMEGTYPLPEAQLDRFMFKLLVKFSSREELITILDRTTEESYTPAEKVLDGEAILAWREFVREVVVGPHVKDYAARLVLATHPDSELATEAVRRYVRYGASPRGAQVLVMGAKVRALLAGRFNASFQDVAEMLLPALRHRVILNFEGQAEGIPTDRILRDLLARLPKSPAEGSGAAASPR